MRNEHPPTRTEGLERLAAFLPHAGRDYTSKRNYDLPGHPHVSVLSPYIRHRLITEEEVLASVLGRFSITSADKFVQEVFWRTYWKGWLELRPGVWTAYKRDLKAALDRIATEGGLRRDWEAACKGDTGIAAFDHWARELVDTGYMHNHARMWFASIWIFTLELPWELGADFFLRHLLDGDAASNTLSWRWVAGLQTRGKHYIARASNIAKYTEGRFNPGYQLNTQALPLDGPAAPERRPLPAPQTRDPGLRTGLILTEDDLSPGWLLAEPATATLVVNGANGRSPLAVSEGVKAFSRAALSDAVARNAAQLGYVSEHVDAEAVPDQIESWVRAHDLEQIITPHIPVGPCRDGLAPILDGRRVVEIIRPYDRLCWPHATAGYFKFKGKIPEFIRDLGLAKAA